MLHSNYIQILLNLKDVSIINFSDSSVTIQLPRKPHLCPCCHHTTNSVHDYRLQKNTSFNLLYTIFFYLYF